MKKMLFLMLFIPNIVFAQRHEHVNAFIKSMPDELGRPVKMPERSYNRHFSLDDSVGYKIKQRLFVISSDSVYHLVFHNYPYTIDSLDQFIFSDNDSSWYKQMFRYLSDSLPAIDFTRYELVLYSACGQCLAYCSHGMQESCHRNACRFMDAWFLRDRMSLFVKKE